MPYADREAKQAFLKEYSQDPQYKEYQRKWRRAQRAKLRARVFEILGGEICAHCSFLDKRALQIDHIHGGGVKEIRSSGGNVAIAKKIIKDPEAARKEYQILCANCNWIKRHENNECKALIVM